MRLLNLPPLAQAVLALLTGLAVTLALSPLGINAARRLGLMDIPGASAHKRHTVPTPLAGGLLLASALGLLMAVFDLFQPPLLRILLAAGVVLLFGLLDDRFGFSAWQKFAGQTLAALLLMSDGTTIHIFDALFGSLPFAFWLNQALTLFWLVGIVNAFNLTDSMDGLSSGLAALAFGFYVLFCLASGQHLLAAWSAALLGICLALYAINLTPAHSFLGDSGAQTLGFFLAALGILYDPPQAPQASTWFVPILLVGIPIFDTTLVVFSRFRRGKPVFHADLGHTYHRLVRAGFSPAQAVAALQFVAFSLGNLAYLVIFLPPAGASLVFGGLMLAALLALTWLEVCYSADL